MGADFNFDMYEISCRSSALRNRVESFVYCILINDATRVTRSSSSTVGLFISNVDKRQVTAHSPISNISDDLPIVSIVSTAS